MEQLTLLLLISNAATVIVLTCNSSNNVHHYNILKIIMTESVKCYSSASNCVLYFL